MLTLPLGRRMVFFDGGMGTQLIARGLAAGAQPETWNITHPGAVTEIHAAYLAAGCDVVTANTFGATRLKFGADTAKVIRAGIALARRAVLQAGHGLVAMDMGPLGRLLEPAGDLGFEEAVSLYREAAEAGADADLVLIETMGDPYEMKAAVLGAREGCGLPVAATFTADGNGRLLTGGDAETMAALLDGLGVDLLGLNCGLGGKQMLPLLRRIRQVTDKPLLVQANAGLPQLENGRTVYPDDPETFAAQAKALGEAGAWALGGCCGTTPAHLAAVTAACRDLPPLPLPEIRGLWVSSGVKAMDLRQRPALIGERLNPTGKKAMKEALRNGDAAWLQREALRQEEAGADLLDLNVGLPEIDEPAWMARAVPAVQSVSALPLQLDSPDPEALARGLRLVNGKAVVNSVNGKAAVLDSILPLIKRYGGAVVGLLLDEDGIPETAEGRMAIARRIVERCEAAGIPRRDILLDALTMTVSTGDRNAAVTLETMDRIRRELGVGTVLGVRNVRFGLPARAQLTGAILNPLSPEVMDAWTCGLTLLGKDPGCAGYMARFADRQAAAAAAPAAKPAAQAAPDSLAAAVRRGLEADATAAAEALLAGGRPPLALAEEELLPALQQVGDDYGAGRCFLPQLVMSAQAAQAVFGLVEAALADRGQTRSRAGRLALATVEGDVHDIGKNIVRVLLSSYGFDVLDLGKNVPAERILRAAKEENLKLVGLSALMTTTVPAMEKTIRLLHRELPDCRVMVGGAVLTPEMAAGIGADAYARDAMEAVAYARQVFSAGG